MCPLPTPTTSCDSVPSATLPTLACDVAIMGGGPAGLMVAEQLAQSGLSVHVFESKPSVARKFLMAGKGGLNLTHSEDFEHFVSRYAARSKQLQPWLQQWGAPELMAWVKGLGFDTFVGSSGRVFPTDMKAAPLLRAWLARLKAQSVVFHMRHRWGGWDADGRPLIDNEQGRQVVHCQALVLATGGGSWAKLGSDGAWVPWLQARGVEVAPLQPANCGFDLGWLDGRQQGWSPVFAERFAGGAFKSIALTYANEQGVLFSRQGEFVATQTGVEGSLIYAVSALLRERINTHGHAQFYLDLLPQWSAERVQQELFKPRGSRSLSSHLKGRLGLDGIKASLLYEVLGKDGVSDMHVLAKTIKATPLNVVAPRPIDEAISTAGGVRFEALDAQGMCNAIPGVFFAGEMLDWEAPTGGYLLTACLSSGVQAARGVLSYLRRVQH
ncbi:TIGR03862 family flavoprotein [Lampropedia puyangensis]|uniref:TIGR03862 family flavoprotein n=1 Tax=Lampropedia puyangensis TaxID=1330072 RepID=A0A4S8FE90_9BURK|nr:TIGR03862 family flavoprotein [Lampropedia puyangensis]THU05024.1 TIGR03862 family flavoprotein [Lampropedia puyangensis]